MPTHTDSTQPLVYDNTPPRELAPRMDVHKSMIHHLATCPPVSKFMHLEAQRLNTALRDQQKTLSRLVSRHQALEEEQRRRNSFLSQNASHLGNPPLVAKSEEDHQVWKKCRAFESQTKALAELLEASLAQCEQTRQEMAKTHSDLAWLEKTQHTSESQT